MHGDRIFETFVAGTTASCKLCASDLTLLRTLQVSCNNSIVNRFNDRSSEIDFEEGCIREKGNVNGSKVVGICVKFVVEPRVDILVAMYLHCKSNRMLYYLYYRSPDSSRSDPCRARTLAVGKPALPPRWNILWPRGGPRHLRTSGPIDWLRPPLGRSSPLCLLLTAVEQFSAHARKYFSRSSCSFTIETRVESMHNTVDSRQHHEEKNHMELMLSL